MLREDVAEWFELGTDSPYMLLVADVVEKQRRQGADARETVDGWYTEGFHTADLKEVKALLDELA